MDRQLAIKRFALCTLCLALVISDSGCWGQRKLDAPEATAPKAKTLRLAVANDPAIAERVRLLKAEWNASTGGSLEVSELAEVDVKGKVPAADALIMDAVLLGSLVECGWIVPVPKQVFAAQDTAWSDVFELVQQSTASWGEQVWAVPFGSPVFTLLYRRDLLEKLHREPPATWEEYQELAVLLRDRDKLGELAPPADQLWYGTLEPTAPGWGGKLLLARAAAYAKHPDNYSTLFNIEDFTPLIDGPPFVLALEQLVAAAKTRQDMKSATSVFDPAGVREAFLGGRCGMAITWPTAASGQGKIEHPVTISFAELPGSRRSYNFSSQTWEARGEDLSGRVPLVPVSGRVGVVLASSPHKEEAFRLLTWLSGSKWGTRVAAASGSTTLYRRSQMEMATDWVEAGLDPAAGKQYATTVQDALSRAARVDGLRIPGHAEYYAALDEAVDKALRGEQSPKEGLGAAAATWRQIGERLGVEQQLKVYRRSLGLDK